MKFYCGLIHIKLVRGYDKGMIWQNCCRSVHIASCCSGFSSKDHPYVYCHPRCIQYLSSSSPHPLSNIDIKADIDYPCWHSHLCLAETFNLIEATYWHLVCAHGDHISRVGGIKLHQNQTSETYGTFPWKEQIVWMRTVPELIATIQSAKIKSFVLHHFTSTKGLQTSPAPTLLVCWRFRLLFSQRLSHRIVEAYHSLDKVPSNSVWAHFVCHGFTWCLV